MVGSATLPLIRFLPRTGWQWSIGSVLMVCLVGCSPGEEISQVTGTVSSNGQPLELIQVEFWPTEGMRSIGKTDDSGKFTLELDDRSRLGAVPGTHKILLRDTWPTKDDVLGPGGEWIDNSNGKRARISSRYYDVSQTPLSFEVKPGENHFDIEAEPRK